MFILTLIVDRGWLHLPMSKAEEDPLFELIRPRGVLMRFLLSRYMDPAFIYEMVPDSLPVRTLSTLNCLLKQECRDLRIQKLIDVVRNYLLHN